jgi:SAM-dependent methyltransferase
MGSGETERPLGEVFDSVAVDYDLVRRGYPTVLVDAAIVRGGLGSGSLVLEVGCGTGKLTELLAARQLSVDAVDPGPRMIEEAKRRVGVRDDVRFHVGRFEDVALPDKAFDAVFSATAFHWVDPLIGWAKAASHLGPGGLLALLAHMTVHDDRSAVADEGFHELLRKHAPTVAEGHPLARDLDAILAGAGERAGNVSKVWDWVMGAGRRRLTNIEAADLFEDVEVTSHVTTIEETAHEFLAHFRTTSLYFEIDPAKRQAFEDDNQQLIEGLGGVVTFALATVLLTARRTNHSPYVTDA